ncbi:hypothetical protein HAX54_016651 [Datura stramonium]|uniref:Uncharacterized protein n=1 Tax=Datura stramonium TaxID=4076 RepID=A0ABS8Y825_DATST|nr:hypothetical protein [Datura stramonium]
MHVPCSNRLFLSFSSIQDSFILESKFLRIGLLLANLPKRAQARRSAGSEEFRKLDPGRLTPITKDFETDRYADQTLQKQMTSLPQSSSVKEQWTEMAVLYLTLVFNEEPAPRPFCAINPSGRRLVVGGPAELSEKGSLIVKGLALGLEPGGCSRNPFFLVVHSGVRTHLRGLQVTVTEWREVSSTDDIQGWM